MRSVATERIQSSSSLNTVQEVMIIVLESSKKYHGRRAEGAVGRTMVSSYHGDAKLACVHRPGGLAVSTFVRGQELSVAVLTQFGYVALALVVAGESAGLPIPGETALIAGAALAAQGHLNIGMVLATAAIAAIVGDNLGYGLGRLGGYRLLSARGPWRDHRVRLLARGDAFFTRHGALAVVFGRWTPVLRVTASVLAGTHRMDWRRFVVWNTVGGVTWVLTIGGVAYLLAGRLPGALPALGLVMTATWVSALIGRYVYRRWASSAASGARAARGRIRAGRGIGRLSAPIGWRIPAYAVSLGTMAMLACAWLDVPEL